MEKTYSTDALWGLLKVELSKLFPKDVFDTWFKPLKNNSYADCEKLELEAGNDFAVMWLENNYKEVLESKLAVIAGKTIPIKFKTDENCTEVTEKPKQSINPTTAERSKPSTQANADKSLNPSNTFNNFVVGAGSQLAHAAAIAVANEPARAYNPLFLYGNTGLGKTHLMHAVGHHIIQNQPSAKVAYVSTERFTNEFIMAIQENQLTKFRKKYRSQDVLLIDDIHFLAGKERIQEEFFHTFNELFESQRQIFLCSDRPASEIAKLESRLVSRFQWGLVCDIQPPDFETRLAILSKKAKSMNLDLEPEILDFLAERVTKNVRRMEGALNRLSGYKKLLNAKNLTVAHAEKFLEDILLEELSAQITIEDVQKKICEFYRLTMSDILSKKRPNNISFPRQIAMYLCRILTQSSLHDIGESFGGRDHGTVIHACKTIETMLQQDQSLKRTVQFLQQKLMQSK